MEYRNDNGCRNIYCGQTRVPQSPRVGTSPAPRGEMAPPPPPTCGTPCVTAPGVPTLAGLPLAMVYSPNQEWCELLPLDEALKKGTLFGELVKPWSMSCCPNVGCSRNGGCASE